MNDFVITTKVAHFSGTRYTLDIRQTTYHESRFHEKVRVIVSENRPWKTAIVTQLDSSMRRLRLDCSNATSTHTEANDVSVCAEMRKANEEQLDKIATEHLFE